MVLPPELLLTSTQECGMISGYNKEEHAFKVRI
jgi:hypothetical protein